MNRMIQNSLSPQTPSSRRRPGSNNTANSRKRLPQAAILIALFFTFLTANNNIALACTPAPTPIRDLDLARYYSDKAGIEIDLNKRAEKRKAVKPLKMFLIDLAKDADRVWRSRKPNSTTAACPLGWLTDWAKANALMGRMTSKQAEYERKWALAGLAMSYVKLRPFATPQQRSLIDAWLIRLADECRAFFDNPGRKRNNHWYWLGLGLAAVGLATESERHWDEARSIMQDASNDIQPNGTLPMELKRGKRALHYHNFSAQPLFAMTLLARAKGEDWAEFNNRAFQRLVLFISAAKCAAQPVITHKSTEHQEIIKAKDFEAGWLQQYLSLNPHLGEAPCLSPNHRSSRASNYHRLGGDLSTLIRAIEAIYK